MNKAIIILQREYLTRIRKKSFIISTILVPLAFAAIIFVPAWLAVNSKDTKARTVGVYDAAGIFAGRLADSENTQFIFIDRETFEGIRNTLKDVAIYDVLLQLPADIMTSSTAQMFSNTQVSMDFRRSIARMIEHIIETDKKAVIIEETGIPDLEERLALVNTSLNLETILVSSGNQEVKTYAELAMGIGYVGGFMIYMFVFIYGTILMRGVMEEKSSRIVEVIISSVKPSQLMFGKIIGIGLLGITQLLIWFVIGAALIFGVTSLASFSGSEALSVAQSSSVMGVAGADLPADNNFAAEIAVAISSLNLPLIAGCFIFYFLGGFLMYASLMGAMAAAADHEEDVQQFMLPVTFPLILSIIILVAVMQNPEGQLAFWTSLIPFTSPVIMMVRVPFGVPAWELALSMVLLILSIWGTIMVAAKIYRTGILMYGKKVNFKEVAKWLFYKH